MPQLSNKQRTASWTISGIAAVVAGVIAVQAWAKDNFVTQDQAKLVAVEQRVVHDKQNVYSELERNETRLALAEMRADRLVDLEDLSPREERELGRLEKEIDYYSKQVLKLRNRGGYIE